MRIKDALIELANSVERIFTIRLFGFVTCNIRGEVTATLLLETPRIQDTRYEELAEPARVCKRVRVGA